MSNFTGLINSLPMDPSDNRLFYGIDFTKVIDDGGTLVNPTATISVADAAKGVLIGDISMSGNIVLFRPVVQSGNQADSIWNGDGDRILVTATIEDDTAKIINRSGLLWIAQR